MRPLLDALPHNTHLSRLSFWATGMSAAFARDVLLPAVADNTSLRSLSAKLPLGHDDAVTPVLRAAEAVVAARNNWRHRRRAGLA